MRRTTRPVRSFGGLLCLAVLGLVLQAPAGSAAAAGWTSAASSSGAEAGLAAASGLDTMIFSCRGLAKGAARLVFTGFEPRLQRDLDRTVVVTVDATAYRQTTRAEADTIRGGSDLVRVAAMADLAGLIAALKTGTKAEIASPAGRRIISLKGSGKALLAFEAGCR